MTLLTKLFSSQKFIVLLVSVIGVLITKIFKVTVDPSTIMELVILIGSYIIGQSITDNGKGAAQVAAIAAVAATVADPANNMTHSDGIAAVDAIKSV